MSKRKLKEVKDFLDRLKLKADAFEIAIRDEGLYILDTEGGHEHGWYACYTEFLEEINDPWDVPRKCLHPKEDIRPISHISYTQCKKCGVVFGGQKTPTVKDLKVFLNRFSGDCTIHFTNEKLFVQEPTEKSVKPTYFDEYKGEIKTRGSAPTVKMGGKLMGGSESLEVVRNMKNLCLFTATASLLGAVSVVLSNTVAVLGYPLTIFFVCVFLYLSRYSMKQRKLWVENETRLLKVQSSISTTKGEVNE